MVFKARTLSIPQPRSQEDLLAIHGRLHRFDLSELILATDNFSRRNVIGRGAFGKVYRGRLPSDGSSVAIKRLGRSKRNRRRGSELQFQAEISFERAAIGNHRNLIRVRGFCATRKERVLVYPYMARGSLASELRYPNPPAIVLDWPKRKRIALGIAKGIAHLHHGCDSKLVHRDLKADNILLDDDFEPVIGDFGLVVVVDRNSNQHRLSPPQNLLITDLEEEDDNDEDWSSDDETSTSCITKLNCGFSRTIKEAKSKSKSKWSFRSTRSGSYLPNRNRTRNEPKFDNHNNFTEVCTEVRGTIGYIAPEYLSTGKCSAKCDVYGYGIVLLELISGQRAYDCARRDDRQYIIDWARDEKLELVVDPYLRGFGVEDEVEKMVQVALLCTMESPERRPEMSEVVEMVEAIGRERFEQAPIERPKLEPRSVMRVNDPNPIQIQRPIQDIHVGNTQPAASLWVLRKCRFNHASVLCILFASVCMNCLLFMSLLAKW